MYKILLNLYIKTKEKFITKKVILWFIYGVITTFLSTILLFYFVDISKIDLPLASALSGEISLLIRYLMNNFLIFESKNLGMIKLLKFHIAMLLGFSIWWSITNILSFFGLHYIVAALTATLISTLINLVTNFKWVWGKN